MKKELNLYISILNLRFSKIFVENLLIVNKINLQQKNHKNYKFMKFRKSKYLYILNNK